jgi:hypothetical protein
MYRTIDSQVHDDPKFKKLTLEGKYLFLYLITNRHSHLSGIYYLPDCLIAHETGIPIKRLDALWRGFDTLSIAFRDRSRDLVWVKNMLKYQSTGQNAKVAVVKHLLTLEDSKLKRDFIQYYPDLKGIRAKHIRYPSDTPPIPIDTPSDTPPDGLRHQEQEQEQEQEKEQYCTERSEGDHSVREVPQEAVPSSPVVLTLLLNDGSEYGVTEEVVGEFKNLYQGVDVDQELRTMKGWCFSNPKKRKTRTGILRFINSWLADKQNGGRLGGNGARPNPPPRADLHEKNLGTFQRFVERAEIK